MSEEPRAATDVLVDIDQKLDLLIKLVKSNDLNQKIKRDRLNKYFSAQEEPKQSVAPAVLPVVSASFVEEELSSFVLPKSEPVQLAVPKRIVEATVKPNVTENKDAQTVFFQIQAFAVS